MENMIRVTGINLVAAIQAAYALSHPVGMGFMHYEPGELAENEAKYMINNEGAFFQGKRNIVNLDYVKGRACKFAILQTEDGELYMQRNWYDHSIEQYQQWFQRMGLPVPEELVSGVYR